MHHLFLHPLTHARGPPHIIQCTTKIDIAEAEGRAIIGQQCEAKCEAVRLSAVCPLTRVDIYPRHPKQAAIPKMLGIHENIKPMRHPIPVGGGQKNVNQDFRGVMLDTGPESTHQEGTGCGRWWSQASQSSWSYISTFSFIEERGRIVIVRGIGTAAHRSDMRRRLPGHCDARRKPKKPCCGNMVLKQKPPES